MVGRPRRSRPHDRTAIPAPGAGSRRKLWGDRDCPLEGRSRPDRQRGPKPARGQAENRGGPRHFVLGSAGAIAPPAKGGPRASPAATAPGIRSFMRLFAPAWPPGPERFRALFPDQTRGPATLDAVLRRLRRRGRTVIRFWQPRQRGDGGRGPRSGGVRRRGAAAKTRTQRTDRAYPSGVVPWGFPGCRSGKRMECQPVRGAPTHYQSSSYLLRQADRR